MELQEAEKLGRSRAAAAVAKKTISKKANQAIGKKARPLLAKRGAVKSRNAHAPAKRTVTAKARPQAIKIKAAAADLTTALSASRTVATKESAKARAAAPMACSVAAVGTAHGHHNDHAAKVATAETKQVGRSVGKGANGGTDAPSRQRRTDLPAADSAAARAGRRGRSTEQKTDHINGRLPPPSAEAATDRPEQAVSSSHGRRRPAAADGMASSEAKELLGGMRLAACRAAPSFFPRRPTASALSAVVVALVESNGVRVVVPHASGGAETQGGHKGRQA
jgi:hypothetical protein